MKKNNFIWLYLFLAIFVSCDPAYKEGPNAHTTITFVNNSNKYLYVRSFYISTEKASNFASLYKSAMANQYYEKVYPNDTYNRRALCLIWNYWESVLSPNANPRQDTTWVYVIDADKLEREKTCTKDMIYYCYGLTLSDLYRLNWSISYPPTPEMKDIKMYPAYTESAKEETDEQNKDQ